jgi:hypothetical protein
MSITKWLFDESAPKSGVLVRVMVGWVFLSEAIQKFLYAAALVVGRFREDKNPGASTPCVFRWRGRNCVWLAPDSWTSNQTGRNPVVDQHLRRNRDNQNPNAIQGVGFRGMMHEARNDFCMFLGLVFLIAVGSRRLSFDARLRRFNP